MLQSISHYLYDFKRMADTKTLSTSHYLYDFERMAYKRARNSSSCASNSIWRDPRKRQVETHRSNLHFWALILVPFLLGRCYCALDTFESSKLNRLSRDYAEHVDGVSSPESWPALFLKDLNKAASNVFRTNADHHPCPEKPISIRPDVSKLQIDTTWPCQVRLLKFPFDFFFFWNINMEAHTQRNKIPQNRKWTNYFNKTYGCPFLPNNFVTTLGDYHSLPQKSYDYHLDTQGW